MELSKKTSKRNFFYCLPSQKWVAAKLFNTGIEKSCRAICVSPAHITNLHRDLPTDAKLGVGFQEQIKLLLFAELSELPAKDRLKAIEDYQQCIQKLHVDLKK